jgi:2-polyprenyl-6-methoxyphenol hydroxylase-like FAD-dependent oxidoreductase
MTIDKSVLIVGGSLNGLTTAMLLSKRNVPCFVVERHPHTSIQYKFRGISPRSMEIYRYAGIEAQILANDETHGHSGHIARTFLVMRFPGKAFRGPTSRISVPPMQPFVTSTGWNRF